MTGADEEGDPTGLEPAAAFSVLGNEHRVAILRALLELSREGSAYPASFSTLRERSGVAVSSQFSYHLEELVGHFVRRTDEGYEFRYAGWKVATAILAGTYTRRAAFGPAPIDGTCPLCGRTALEATYEEEWLRVDCTACGARLTRYPFPPGGLAERSPAEFLAAFDRHVRSHVRLAGEGVCPACTGPMAPAVYPPESTPDHGRLVEFDCTRCGNSLHPRVGLFLVDHPLVRGFYRDHGREADDVPFWELAVAVSPDSATVVSTDPWRCAVSLALDGDELVLELDDELDVVAERRTGEG